MSICSATSKPRDFRVDEINRASLLELGRGAVLYALLPITKAIRGRSDGTPLLAIPASAPVDQAAAKHTIRIDLANGNTDTPRDAFSREEIMLRMFDSCKWWERLF